MSNTPAKLADFFVALSGSDSWSGTLPEPNVDGTDGPFATPIRARNAVRELKKSGESGAITVMFRGGTYFLHEPLFLAACDSGTKDSPITYRNYPGENAVLSGGRPITGWSDYKGEIKQVLLQDVLEGRWFFRELYFKGKRQVRARWPKFDPADPLYGGWEFVEEGLGNQAFRFAPGACPKQWAKPRQAEVFTIPWLNWNNDIIPIESIDYETNTIRLQRPMLNRLNQASGTTDCMEFLKNNRFRVENVLEELTQPGEWCLDSETGILYFWPPEGSIEGGEVVAPYLDRVISLYGSPGDPVEFVEFRGLTITQNNSLFPRPEILIHNYPNSGGCGLRMEGVENCVVEGCRFEAVGGDGIRMQGYNADNWILRNEISYTGASGICLCGDNEMSARSIWKDPALLRKQAEGRPRSKRNQIERNNIHHVGELEKRGSGIYIFGLCCVNNIICDNTISHIPQRGIMVQHGFGSNIIEHNEISLAGLETADTGGIDVLVWMVIEGDNELDQGNIIRYNVVRDVVGSGAYDKPLQPVVATVNKDRIMTPYYSWAIYFDWNVMDQWVYGNVAVGNVLGGVMLLGDCKDIVIENNILVNGSRYQVYLASLGPDAKDNRFVHNVICYTDPQAHLVSIQKELKGFSEYDENIYFHSAGLPLTIDPMGGSEPMSLEQWREAGFDRRSIVTDPGFTDPANGDYTFRPDSPALALDIEDVAMIAGVRPETEDEVS